jgi:thiol-disulfide isomerase/thioredoxin
MKHRLFGVAAFLAISLLPAVLAADMGPAAGAPAPAVAPTHTKGSAPLHVSHGAKFKLEDYVVPGKTTVFDFYSEYCPPCRAIAPHLEKLHAGRADVAVVKVDINRPDHRGIDWTSPVARQYGLQSVPQFKVIGPDGKLKSEGDAAYDLVVGMIKAQEG